jgi:alpha-L-fucosidase
MMNRRKFSRLSAFGLGMAAVSELVGCKQGTVNQIENVKPGKAEAEASEVSGRGEWFKQARYGMFISYSVYSILGQGSWAIYLNQIPVHEYKKLMGKFNPRQFSAKEWVRLVKDSGQRYITLIAKHRDGFSMYDTKLSDFSIIHTPFGRDLCKEVVEECHRQGITFSFYYQLRDWTNPAYRQSFKRGSAVSQEYIDFMHGQVRELCTNYGKLGAIWFDGGADHTPEQWRAAELIAMIRKLQPDALVDDRTGLPGDFSTPEEAFGGPSKAGRLWEHCMTMNDHWGYDSSAQRYKSPGQIVQLLVRTVAGGGNLLLNVGPEASGIINPASAANLREAGKWMERNGESIYGAGPFHRMYYENIFATMKDDKVYLHIFDWPTGAWGDFTGLHIGDAKRVYYLETREEIKMSRTPIGLRLRTRNNLHHPSPDTVVVFEGIEPLKPPESYSVPA